MFALENLGTFRRPAFSACRQMESLKAAVLHAWFPLLFLKKPGRNKISLCGKKGFPGFHKSFNIRPPSRHSISTEKTSQFPALAKLGGTPYAVRTFPF